MHIIIMVVVILSGLAVWYQRLKALRGAARDVGNFAKRARNAPRKHAFKKRAETVGIKAVDDPREAATILMILVAGAYADEPLESAFRTSIEREVMKAFDFSLKEADDIITLALWRVQEIDYPSAVAKRMSQLIARDDSLGEKELIDLEVMMTSVMKTHWNPSDAAEDILQIYRHQAGLVA